MQPIDPTYFLTLTPSFPRSPLYVSLDPDLHPIQTPLAFLRSASIGEVYLDGGYGGHVHLDSAMVIGLVEEMDEVGSWASSLLKSACETVTVF